MKFLFFIFIFAMLEKTRKSGNFPSAWLQQGVLEQLSCLYKFLLRAEFLGGIFCSELVADATGWRMHEVSGDSSSHMFS